MLKKRKEHERRTGERTVSKREGKGRAGKDRRHGRETSTLMREE